MIDQIIHSRIYIFLAFLTILITFEFIFSWRKREISRKDRWWGNFSLVIIDSVLVKLLFPIGASGFAIWLQKNDYGTGLKLNIVLTIIIFDLLIYFQHVMSHKFKWFWTFHVVHHSDPDLDVSSALRFHPIEIIISMFYKFLLIFILGPDPSGIIIFEIILNSMAMFNHSNLLIPKKIEKFLRYFIVTPQMHLIHHSRNRSESDTNYGFNISLWDRIFSTYLDKFTSKQSIGQNYLNKIDDQKLKNLLIQPYLYYKKKYE